MVDKTLISDREDRELYERRELAIFAYIRDERMAGIEQRHSLPRSEILRLFQRGLITHPDGRIWGCRAWVPGTRIENYRRVAPESTRRTATAGYAGMFLQLLCRYPPIQERIENLFLKKCRGPHISRLPISPIFKAFIQACRDCGVKATEYPFTVKNLGRTALANYLRGLFKSDLRAAVRAQCGAVALRTLNVGTEQRLPVVTWRPLQRVGFDGHRIDAIFTILVPDRSGRLIPVELDRPWLLLIVDVVTRAVLGWTLSLNPEYTKEDVMNCVRSAIEPGTQPVLTTAGLVFDTCGGMPCWVFPAMRWALWDELSYDNGKANLSDWVRQQLISILEVAVNPGPVATPEHQAIIEALFRILESRSTQLLPNTVGSNPTDSRRKKDPGAAARRYGLRLNHLEELLAVVIANYNGTPHESLGFRSPLEQLGYLIREEGIQFRHVVPDKRRDIGLLSMKVTVTVRGNVRKGRRPYVQFERERYSSDTLGQMPELIGKEIQILVSTEDLTSVRAFLASGAEFSTLVALGGWRKEKHSLATRRVTNRQYVRRVEHEAATSNPVVEMLANLQPEAPHSRKAASRYEQIRRQAGLPEDFNPTAAQNEGDGDDEPTENGAPVKRKRQVILY